MDAIPRLDGPSLATPTDPGNRGTPSPDLGPSAEPLADTIGDERGSSAVRDPATTPVAPAIETLNGVVAELREAIERATSANLEAHIRPAEEGRAFVIEIVDGETGELVSQFPPEKLLNLRHRLDELVGMIIDRKI